MKDKIHQDIYIGIFIILSCAAFFIMAMNLPSGAATLPIALLVVLALLACKIIWDGVRKTKTATIENPVKNTISLSKLKVPAITYLYIGGYAVLFSLTGYFVSTTVFLIALMRRFNMTSWKQILLIAAGFVFLIYALFVKQLNVPVLNFGYLEHIIAMRR